MTLDSVQRRVVPAGDTHTVILARTYDTTIDDLWDACTNPDRIPRWFLPISGDLRLNGRYQLEGNAGGTIERCEPRTIWSGRRRRRMGYLDRRPRPLPRLGQGRGPRRGRRMGRIAGRPRVHDRGQRALA